MATFKVSVTYGDGEPQVTEKLTASQANQGMGAFLRDMLGLEDSAITRLVIERNQQRELHVEEPEEESAEETEYYRSRLTDAERSVIDRLFPPNLTAAGEGSDEGADIEHQHQQQHTRQEQHHGPDLQ